MSALAEALLAAQRQACGVLAKSFVGGRISGEVLLESLDQIGCRDTLDQALLLQSLITIQTLGGEAPAATGTAAPTTPEPATEAQAKFIARLVEDRGVVAPDGPLTKEQASKVIEQLKAGTYNADEWTVPF